MVVFNATFNNISVITVKSKFQKNKSRTVYLKQLCKVGE
jgi:hypothetical protein